MHRTCTVVYRVLQVVVVNCYALAAAAGVGGGGGGGGLLKGTRV
jgi:hypothetical protein